MAERNNRTTFSQASGGGAILSGGAGGQSGGIILPNDDYNVSLTTNVNLASAGANAGYFVQKHLPCNVNFTKATVSQPSGTVAGVNVYYSIYGLNGQLICTMKFTTVGAGTPVTLAGVISQGPASIFLPIGDYYFMLAEDSVPASGTIGAIATFQRDFEMRNANGFRNAFKAGVLSGGLMPTSIDPTTFTKTTTGHMGGSAIAAVFVEP